MIYGGPFRPRICRTTSNRTNTAAAVVTIANNMGLSRTVSPDQKLPDSVVRQLGMTTAAAKKPATVVAISRWID
jgi:hypothetical protein